MFADGVEIVDDPHRRRGLASRPFDGEGVATRRHMLVDQGRLTAWLLDSSSARQLGLATTGHAGRGTGSPKRASQACCSGSWFRMVPVASPSSMRAPKAFESTSVSVSAPSSFVSSSTGTETAFTVTIGAKVSVPAVSV